MLQLVENLGFWWPTFVTWRKRKLAMLRSIEFRRRPEIDSIRAEQHRRHLPGVLPVVFSSSAHSGMRSFVFELLNEVDIFHNTREWFVNFVSTPACEWDCGPLITQFEALLPAHGL
jgi:hypothetical protein